MDQIKEGVQSGCSHNVTAASPKRHRDAAGKLLNAKRFVSGNPFRVRRNVGGFPLFTEERTFIL